MIALDPSRVTSSGMHGCLIPKQNQEEMGAMSVEKATNLVSATGPEYENSYCEGNEEYQRF